MGLVRLEGDGGMEPREAHEGGGRSRRPRSRPPCVVPLFHVAREGVERVGGKALRLAEAHDHGFAVPEGYCVTTAALDQVLALPLGSGGEGGEGKDCMHACHVTRPALPGGG